MTKTLSSREVMKRSWDSSSEDEKIDLLISAYEAFARERAFSLRKTHVLPKYGSYQNLRRRPISVREKRQFERATRTFRTLAQLLAKEGLFYRDFLEGVFYTWPTPSTPKEAYRSRYNVPSAFPLPQHLLLKESINGYYKWIECTEITVDTPEDRREGAKQTLDAIVNRRRFRSVKDALKDPWVLDMMPPEFLRISEEFIELFRSGYYRRTFGEPAHAYFLKILSG